MAPFQILFLLCLLFLLLCHTAVLIQNTTVHRFLQSFIWWSVKSPDYALIYWSLKRDFFAFPFLSFKGIGRFCLITVRRGEGRCIHPGDRRVVPDPLEASDCPPVRESSVPLLEATLLSWFTLMMWVVLLCATHLEWAGLYFLQSKW